MHIQRSKRLQRERNSLAVDLINAMWKKEIAALDASVRALLPQAPTKQYLEHHMKHAQSEVEQFQRERPHDSIGAAVE